MEDITEINMCTYRTKVKHNNYLKPKSLSELESFLKSNRLSKHHICSSGRNWGYGSKLGHESETTLIDVSELNKIEINEAHSVITIEPGVTQKALYKRLKEINSNLMISITGSSPNTSLIGNMKSHGYGNGRSTVRVEDLLQVNGYDENHNYVNGIDNSTCKYGDSAISNKIIFNEKSIITKAKFRLKPIPEKLLLFCFSIENEEKFSPLIERLNYIKGQGLIEGNWSLFSAHRLLAENNSKSKLFSNTADISISFEEARKKLNEFGYNIWTGSYNGVFACYMPCIEIAKSVEGFISKQLSNVSDKFLCVNASKEEIIQERNCGNGFDNINVEPPILSRLRTFSGILKHGSMDIIYWAKNQKLDTQDPDKDKCGFIWNAFSLPNDHKLIRTFMNSLNQAFFEKNLDPIYVIDGVLPHETYFMVSLIYDFDDVKAERQAKDLHRNLNVISNELGVVNFKRITPFE